MKFNVPHVFRPALLLTVVIGLSCPSGAWAAIPSGATTSLDALRQAYIDAVRSRNAAALESLIDTSPLKPKALAELRRSFVTDDFAHGITDVVLKDADPDTEKDYSKYHLHFTQPITKVLETTYDTHFIQGRKFYISTDSRRYYFIYPARDEKKRPGFTRGP